MRIMLCTKLGLVLQSASYNSAEAYAIVDGALSQVGSPQHIDVTFDVYSRDIIAFGFRNLKYRISTLHWRDLHGQSFTAMIEMAPGPPRILDLMTSCGIVIK